MKKRKFVKLAITREDINKTMRLKSDHVAIHYWEKIIMDKISRGCLSNNRNELIYWMTGITDGLIKF